MVLKSRTTAEIHSEEVSEACSLRKQDQLMSWPVSRARPENAREGPIQPPNQVIIWRDRWEMINWHRVPRSCGDQENQGKTWTSCRDQHCCLPLFLHDFLTSAQVLIFT